MSRLVFEDDDVIQEALMMDSFSDGDCNLIDTGTASISPKENTNKSTVQEKEDHVLKNVEEVSTNKEMEENRVSENREECRNCLQVFEKKELENHDCGKKKRKSLVLSFHKNLSITSTLNRKSDIKNDTPRSDKRLSIDSNTSEKVAKLKSDKRLSIDTNTSEKVVEVNRRKSSKHDNENTKNLDENELNLDINTSKTPIFYECSVCLKHFSKKEFDKHLCRDESPCLTLRFSTSSSFNKSVDKNNGKLKRSEKSVSFEKKSSNNKEKAQVKRKNDNSVSPATDPKHSIKPQNNENQNLLEKVNQPILLEKETQNGTLIKKSIKRKYSGAEKSIEIANELKTIKRKIDKQNNEANQTKDTTLDGIVGDVNTIVATETPNQKAITKNTDQPNDRKATSKNDNSDQLETVDTKSTPNIKDNVNFENEKSKVNPDKEERTPNKKTDPIQENVEKSRSVLLHNIDTELKQNNLNKRKIAKSQRKIDKISGKLLKPGKMTKRNKLSLKKVISERYKLFRLNDVKFLLEKEKGVTGNQNLENKEAEVVTAQNEHSRDSENENLKNQEGAIHVAIKSQSKERKTVKDSGNLLEQAEVLSQSSNKLSKTDEKLTKNANKNAISEKYKLFRLNDLKFLLEKEKGVTGNQSLENKEAEVVKTLDEEDRGSENENSKNQRDDEGKRNLINVKALTLNEKNDGSEQEKSINIESNQQGYKTKRQQIYKEKKSPNFQKKYKCRLCHAKYININHYHMCKDKVKKIKFKKNIRQNIKKADMILKNSINNSQSKINITILARDNVKIVTVSKNAKDYEVNQGKISNYLHSDQIANQSKIIEISEQILTNIPTETISQSERINISKDKTFEIGKETLHVTGKPESIVLEHKKAAHNLDTTSKKLTICEESSKIQESNATSLKEPQKQNNNENYDEKQLINEIPNNLNPTDVEKNILSQNADHSYSLNNEQKNENRESYSKISAENVDHHTAGKVESIELQHRNAAHNLDTTLKELSLCEEISKKQENNATPLEEPQNQKYDEKQLINELHNKLNPTDVENTILSQTVDHSYSMPDVGKTQSIITANSELTGSTQDVEHNYSVTEDNAHNIFLCKMNHRTSKCTKSDTIITQNERTVGTEITSTINEENVKDVIMGDVENDITVPEIVESEITIPECEITTSESEITSPENLGSQVTIPVSMGSDIMISECEITSSKHGEIIITESLGSDLTVGNEITILENETKIPQSEITIPQSDITVPESEITVTTQNNNTTFTQNIDIVNSTYQNETKIEIVKSKEHVANDVQIAPQNIELNNSELKLEDNIVSIDNVAQEIIIPASLEENKTVSTDLENHFAVATHIKDDSFVSIENVAQEVIITNENIETDDVSLGNVGKEIVLLTDRDRNVEVNQNTNNIVETFERIISMTIVEHIETEENLANEIIITTQIEGNDNIASAQIKENIKGTYSESAGLNNDRYKQHNKNRESHTKISAENVEQHTRIEEIEKVSVESLENEVFVSNYVVENDLIKDVQIDTNVATTDVKASDLTEDVQTNETYISKQDETFASTPTKPYVSTKNVEVRDTVNAQNETKYVEPSDAINDNNILTQNVNESPKNIGNTIVKLPEANQDPTTVNIGSVLVQNELTVSAEKEQGVLSRQSGEIQKNIPTNDEIETIIIISCENENKKNIVLTQNEKNETIIIISKQKDEIPADCNTTSRIKEITGPDHQIENVVVSKHNNSSLTEKEELENKSERKCLNCSKIFTKDEFEAHNCTEEGRDKIKRGRVSKFKFRNRKILPKKGFNNHKCAKNVVVKENKENTLTIETKLAAILNQNDSQNNISEIQEHSGTHKCDKNNEGKEDKTLESQLAAILNQNESHDEMNSRISLANNSRNDKKASTYEAPITDNQLLDILSKNVEDTSPKENSSKTKCFRCSKEFTDPELTTHNCLEHEETTTTNLEIKTNARLEKCTKEFQENVENSDEIEKNTTNLKIKTYARLENCTKKMRENGENSDKNEKNTPGITEPKQNDDTAENKVIYVIEIKEKSDPKERISKTNCIRCFKCSGVYDKTHKCSNIKQEPVKNTSIEKPDINIQDATFKKKNKYCFEAFIIVTKHGMFMCKICNKEYTARKNLVRHIHQHEKDYDTERFKCSTCPKTFPYKTSLKSHEASHTGETHSCSICDKTFSRKNNLHTHITNFHSDESNSSNESGKEYDLNKNPNIKTELHSCEMCGKEYKQKNNLIDHFLRTHSEINLSEYDKQKFESKNTNKHTQNSAAVKLQNENIKNEDGTVKQIATTNKNSKLSCKTCSKTLKTISQRKQHEWRHENKQFFCNSCPKKFNSKHYLQLHLANHAELGIKREMIDCPQCEKQFVTKFGLKLHLNKHNNVTFSCPLCEKLFSTKLLLKTHERTHTDQKPFVCENCNRAFNNRSNFNKHKINKVCLFRPVLS